MTLKGNKSIQLGNCEVEKEWADIAVANREKAYRGTFAQNGASTWKLSPKEYIVGAILAVTLRLKSTVRKFPKPPAGESTACSRAPGDPEE